MKRIIKKISWLLILTLCCSILMFSQNDSAFWNQNLSPNANHKNNDIYLEHLDNTKDLSHKPISNETGGSPIFIHHYFRKATNFKKEGNVDSMVENLKIIKTSI